MVQNKFWISDPVTNFHDKRKKESNAISTRWTEARRKAGRRRNNEHTMTVFADGGVGR